MAVGGQPTVVGGHHQVSDMCCTCNPLPQCSGTDGGWQSGYCRLSVQLGKGPAAVPAARVPPPPPPPAMHALIPLDPWAITFNIFACTLIATAQCERVAAPADPRSIPILESLCLDGH